MKKLFIVSAIALSLSTQVMAKEKKQMSSETAWGLGTGATIGAVFGGPVGAFAGAFIGGLIGEKEAAENTVEQQQIALNNYADTEQTLNDTLARNAQLNAQLSALEAEQLRLEQAKIDNLLAMTVQFRTGSSTIEPHFAKQLDELAIILQRQPSITLDLHGFADQRGDEQKNLELSQQRAQAVQDYLVSHGIAASRLTTQSHGEGQLASQSNDYEGHFFDRRVTLHAKGQNAAKSVAKN